MPRLEAVVQAGAHGIGLVAHFRTERRAGMAEIGVEIFDLRGPRTGKRGFHGDVPVEDVVIEKAEVV